MWVIKVERKNTCDDPTFFPNDPCYFHNNNNNNNNNNIFFKI